MAHYRMLDREPSAIITVNGSEKKIYNNGQIFLNDGENFEIRFFNPLQEKIGVEIIFNGQKKNDGLLVLNPGQDVTLDRFLGEKKKMRYETYTIDGNNSAAVQAAALNGLVEFKFYKEHFTNWNNCFYSNCNNFYGGITRGIPGTSTTTTGFVGSTQTFNTSSDSYITSDNFELNEESVTPTSSAPLRSKSVKSAIETGRIEKGPESNQNLSTIDANFESYPFHTITYQLKPNSQRTTEVTEVRNYCPSCGYRVRKQSWKFCPKCGEQF